jgi:hypothetical protein
LIEVKLAWAKMLLAKAIQFVVTLRSIVLIEGKINDDGVSAGTAIRV